MGILRDVIRFASSSSSPLFPDQIHAVGAVADDKGVEDGDDVAVVVAVAGDGEEIDDGVDVLHRIVAFDLFPSPSPFSSPSPSPIAFGNEVGAEPSSESRRHEQTPRKVDESLGKVRFLGLA